MVIASKEVTEALFKMIRIFFVRHEDKLEEIEKEDNGISLMGVHD